MFKMEKLDSLPIFNDYFDLSRINEFIDNQR